MDLKQTLKTVIGRLRSGGLDSEAQVGQSAILPILTALDWDVTDPQVLKPEYSTGPGRVDYALLDGNKLLVFIEAKINISMSVGGEEQLFRYAFNRGVPLLVLTDGNRWNFYLSLEEGIPAERRFHQLELKLEHNISEYVKALRLYLRRDRVVSGQAKKSAKNRLMSDRKREKTQRAIRPVWQKMLSKPDRRLRDLLAEKVESKDGTKPELEDVENFLKKFSSHPTTTAPGSPPSITKSPRQQLQSQSRNTRLVGYTLRGESVNTGNGRRTLAALLVRFAREDPEFMERFSQSPKTIGKTRRLVAKERADLYDNGNLEAVQLENGWWLGVNLSKARMLEHIKTACEVAGVDFDTELELQLI